jgi:anti-anti-sigma factor
MSSYQTMRTDEGSRIAVVGGLTSLLVPELQQTLKTEVENGARQVTFDLQETTMLDSSGIGLLIATFNTLTQKDGKIAVINVPPQILKLLRSIRLITRLNVSGRAGQESDHE